MTSNTTSAIPHFSSSFIATMQFVVITVAEPMVEKLTIHDYFECCDQI